MQTEITQALIRVQKRRHRHDETAADLSAAQQGSFVVPPQDDELLAAEVLRLEREIARMCEDYAETVRKEVNERTSVFAEENKTMREFLDWYCTEWMPDELVPLERAMELRKTLGHTK